MDYNGHTAVDIVAELVRDASDTDSDKTVTNSGNERIEEILAVSNGMPGNSESCEPQRKETAGDTGDGSERYDCVAIDHVITTGGNCTAQGACVYTDEKSPTLKAGGTHAVAYGVDCRNAEIIADGNGCLQAGCDHTNNSCNVVAYGISSYDSNSMKSDNPKSGFYEADTARTLDLNGGNPACNQGGIAVCEQPVLCLDRAAFNQGKNALFDFAVEEEFSPPLLARGPNAVCTPYTLKIRGGVERDSTGKQAGKGALIQKDLSATLGVSQDQTLFQPILASGKDTSGCLMASGYDKLGAQEMFSGDYTVVEPMSWDGDNVSPTLTANNAGGNQRMPDKGNFNAVCEPISLETYHCTTETEKAPILKARDYKDPPCVCEPQIYDMTHANDVIRECGSISPTLQNRMGTGGNQIPITVERVIRWIVRRRTPLECERLQGFPDGWTDIGEWTDSKGKKHKDADSPRYKALGNSIAVGYANDMQGYWCRMFRRMAKYLPERATLGSLFDGIGGFPLAWEAIHGKGTARWASEIEEFPIAVTKIHFPEETNENSAQL